MMREVIAGKVGTVRIRGIISLYEESAIAPTDQEENSRAFYYNNVNLEESHT